MIARLLRWLREDGAWGDTLQARVFADPLVRGQLYWMGAR